MPMDRATLQDLEARASRANAERSITGYLTYRNERFTQYLEGSAEDVSETMSRIRTDARHGISVEIELGTNRRRFPGWSMRLLDPLWHPSGSVIDAIEELIGHGPMSRADQDLVRPELVRLVGEVAGNT